MKLKLNKMGMAELLSAAQGNFELDVTEDMLKAIGMDKEAATLNMLTKSEGIGDSRVNEALTAIKASLDALTAAVAAGDAKTLSTIQTSAAPLQPTGDVPKTITDLKAEVAGVKSDLTKVVEQMTQAVATIEALKAELTAKRPEGAGPTTGPVTSEMQEMIRSQIAAVTGRKSDVADGPFAFDALTYLQ